MFWSNDLRIDGTATIVSAGVTSWLLNLGLYFQAVLFGLIIFLGLEFYLLKVKKRMAEAEFENFMKRIAAGVLIAGIIFLGQISFLIAGFAVGPGHDRVYVASYLSVFLGGLSGYFLRDILE